MKIGYARVSTEEQHLDLQIAALDRAGCKKIFTDRGVSGAVFSRPGLDRAFKRLKPGGILVVWKLDRLGRSVKGLIQLIDVLGKRNIQFVSLSENIDTTSPGGKFFFHMMAALAEFERSLISERTRAGMAEARAQGRVLGRRYALSPEQQRAASNAVEIDGQSVTVVSKQYKIAPRTLRRYLRSLHGRPE